jgi:hypothetical protein
VPSLKPLRHLTHFCIHFFERLTLGHKLGYGPGVQFELRAQQVQAFEFSGTLRTLEQAVADAHLTFNQGRYGSVLTH